jgi:ubiquitin-conjugating enzyme E2 J1
MDTDAKGQLGGIECSREVREKMAKESEVWKCPACAKSNADIMKEREELVRETEEKEGKRKEEEIPEELRLAYRDELGEKEDAAVLDKGKGKAVDSPAPAPSISSAPESTDPSVPAPPVTGPGISTSLATPRPTRTTHAPAPQQLAQPSPDRSIALIDTFIYGIVAALLFMVLKRFA